MESRSVGSLHCAWCLCSLELGRADRPGAVAKIGLPSTYFPLQGAGWSGLQSTQTHISGVWVQGHEWQAGRRHCGQRGLIVKAQITSNVLVMAPPLHIWPKMSRHMKGDLYEGHQFSVTMKESARQGHHLHITRSKKTPATSSPLCFSRAP